MSNYCFIDPNAHHLVDLLDDLAHRLDEEGQKEEALYARSLRSKVVEVGFFLEDHLVK